MIVISLANCPPSLRGDLTKWFFEISTNVFVGEVSARIRDDLWDRIKRSCKNGRVVMVFNTDNEQHFDFHVHNGEWELADLEGLKIMRRPLSDRMFTESKLGLGFSKASKYRKMNRISGRQKGEEKLRTFIKITTTGPDPKSDRITSIGSITFNGDCITDTLFRELRDNVDDATEDMGDVLNEFSEFLGENIAVFDDINKSISFIESECKRCGVFVDIREKESMRYIGKKRLYNLRKHDLKSLKEYYGISDKGIDALSDCRAMVEIYRKMTLDL